MYPRWKNPSTYGTPNTSTDELCCWEGSSSELGLETPGGGEPAADPAAAAAADPADKVAAGTDTSTDDPALAAGDGGDADGDDEDVDPLDLLTTREEQDEQTQDRTPDGRYKALSKRARKLERSLKKSLPITQALREAGVDLRTLLNSHARLGAYEASLSANPRLRALLDGAPDDPAAGDRRPAAREESVEYPFDINDPVGRFMSEFHQKATSTQREILDRLDRMEKATNERVGRIEQGTAQQQRSAAMSSWKSAADAAASKLDKPVQKLFRDAVLAAAEGRLSGRHQLTPQQVIDHYLADFKISDGQKQRASAAAQQKTAERNTSLPRRPGNGAGTPASPAARRVPRLEDFNRSLARLAR